MRRALILAFLTICMSAFAKPAHVLYHAGKSVTYPVRHPNKTGHGIWKLITAVL